METNLSANRVFIPHFAKLLDGDTICRRLQTLHWYHTTLQQQQSPQLSPTKGGISSIIFLLVCIKLTRIQHTNSTDLKI
jgi:hypothetical protein